MPKMMIGWNHKMTIENLQKSNLAKLLATENITVQHRKVDTAYFDVKNRILCLPIWKEEMPNDVYDLLVGHEVGHALFTPTSDWAFKQKEVPVSFLNVLEDVRIEKMMKQKFPGLRKNFYDGYQILTDKNFFGIKDKDVSLLKFIDRLNVHYKIGAFAQIPFHNETEMDFVKRAFETQTFDDVFNLAKEIYAYEKQQKQQEQKVPEQSKEQQSGQSDDDTEKMQQPDNTQDEQQEEQESASTNADNTDQDGDELEVLQGQGDINPELNEEEKTGEGKKVSDGREGSIGGDDLEASTDRSMNDKMKSLLDEKGKDNTYVTLPLPNLKQIVIEHKELYKSVKEQDERYSNIVDINTAVAREFKKFKDSSMKTVNYLVKEFEMKKSADAYKKASVSRTGVINVNKLHSYKYNDDIFKKLTIIPDGKNHGMMMFVDWSGSMHKSFYETITQLFNLVFFCQQVKIPFEVYAFSDRSQRLNIGMGRESCWMYKSGDKAMDQFSLLQLFTSTMKKQEFQNACIEIYKVAMSYSNKLNEFISYYYSPCTLLSLGGTPLNAAVLASIPMIKRFKKENQIQKMNTIFLTDGDSHDHRDFFVPVDGNEQSYQVKDEKNGLKYGDMPYENNMVCIDNQTKYSFKMSYMRNTTKDYFELLKRKVDTVLIGFHIVHRKLEQEDIGRIAGKTYYRVNMRESEKIRDSFRKNKFVISTKNGYDEQYYIKGSKDLEINDEGFTVDPNKRTSLVAAFKKYSKNKVMSRVLLNKFIEKVA